MIRRSYIAVVVAPVLMALFAGVAWSAEFAREFSFATDDLKVVNMIGSIQVTEATGNEFQIHTRSIDPSRKIGIVKEKVTIALDQSDAQAPAP